MKKHLNRRQHIIATGRGAVSCRMVAAYREAWALRGYSIPDLEVNTPATTRGGCGTELKKLIGKIGINPTRFCQCHARAKLMDDLGLEWCRYNQDKILGWLREESATRRIPFVAGLAAALLRRAIRAAAIDEPQLEDHPLPAGVTRWAVGITTAPRRQPTLDRTVDSLRRAGWEPIVFAEPGTDLRAADGKDLEIVTRPQRLGCWRNYVQTMRDLVDRHPQADAVLIVQDDVVFSPCLRRFVECDLWPSNSVGCVSFYCPNFPAYETAALADQVGLLKVNHRNLIGACAMAYPMQTARRIIAHPLAADWRGCVRGHQPDPVRKKAVDSWVGHVTRDLRLNNYFYLPSLCQHVAGTSAVGHGGNAQTKEKRGEIFSYRKSVHFRGEQTPPQELWAGRYYWGRWTLPQGHLRFADQPATAPPRPICAIIPGRGLPDLTLACLRRIRASTISRAVVPIYIEDGPPPDWTVGGYREIQRLVQQLGGLCVSLGQPGGYTVATNRGIQLAQERPGRPHVLLLNNDTELGPHCLERLRWHLERHQRTAAVGPLTGDRGRQSVKNRSIAKAARITDPTLTPEQGDRAARRGLVWEFPQLSGFCLLLHGDAVDQLGPLAVDGYPLGLGTDDEWIRRANRAGWRTFLAFDAWCSHQHSATFKNLDQMPDRRRASGAATRTLRGS